MTLFLTENKFRFQIHVLEHDQNDEPTRVAMFLLFLAIKRYFVFGKNPIYYNSNLV